MYCVGNHINLVCVVGQIAWFYSLLYVSVAHAPYGLEGNPRISYSLYSLGNGINVACLAEQIA